MKYGVQRRICCILLLVAIATFAAITGGLVVLPYSNIIVPLIVLFASIVASYWISIL